MPAATRGRSARGTASATERVGDERQEAEQADDRELPPSDDAVAAPPAGTDDRRAESHDDEERDRRAPDEQQGALGRTQLGDGAEDGHVQTFRWRAGA